MYRRSVLLASLSSLFTLCLLGVLEPGRVLAQRGQVDPGIELPRDESADNLTKKFNSKEFRDAWNALLEGKEKPEGKKNLEIIDTAAQWLVYRVTWRSYLEPTKSNAPTIVTVHRDFNNDLVKALKANNAQFLDVFAKHVMKHINEVFKNGRLRPRVNAAMLMERLCQTGRPEMVIEMVRILKSNQPDYIKLYALKGLRELLERQPPVPTDAQERAKRDAFYLPAVNELISYIQKRPDIPKDATPEEKDRISSVTVYLRREAIRALASARMPAVAVDIKTKKVEGPVAYALLKVLTGEGMNPAPSLSEKVEAAAGLALLRMDPDSSYKNDLALYLITQFIAQEFAPAYNEDWARTGTSERTPKTKKKKGEKEEENKEPTEGRRVRAELWKVHAARLKYGLMQMKDTTPDAKTKKNAEEVWKYVESNLFGPSNVLSVDLTTKLRKMDSGAIDTLRKMLDRLKPNQSMIFKGIDSLQLKLGGGEER
jgi:hypothetical protein